MSYSGNMPDWHQYNPPQGRATSTSHPQNVAASHPFISSITPPALDGLSLPQQKHQRTDPSKWAYQPPLPNCPTSSSLTAPGVHMSPLSTCVSHYSSASSRTSMLDAPLDPRMGLNDTEMHRNNQMTFNPPANHTNTNLTVNPNLHTGGMTSQTSPVAPLSPGRQSYPCKLPCCNPEGMSYQHWEKYGYQGNYRDNRGANYQMENRRFPELPRKEPEDRRNYDYKYRKDMRNYSSGLLPNYPMKNYNFPDYQKCPHGVKEYMRRGSIPQNPGIMKYDQKFNKLYQNGSQGNTSQQMQNSYFPTMSREVREFPREYQEPNSSRMQTTPGMLHGGYQKYHVYQQKIAMQRFSLENHLRAMARVPGYQSHPKYQEYVMRYRELLRLQQNVDYQNFLQDPSKLPTSPGVPPINLQFDQNGCLINSSFQSNFPVNQMNPETQNQNQYQDLHQIPENPVENFENMIVDVDGLDPTRSLTSATATMSTTTAPSDSKEFADKPQLDVRQFLANWDETEEEENAPAEVSNTSPVPVESPQKAPEGGEKVEVDKPEDLKTLDFPESSGIVQCIQTDSSDIPTIHIVDHLPEASELATISTVYGDVTSLSIEQIAAPIEINENQREEGIPLGLPEEPPVPEKETEKEPQAEPIQKTQTESNQLKKQHSFASEESHNPDDISLPDLPMSECTPISTTLNTPIHSDSEESSSHVDLAISTNPIEIIQNSPIISFTHSPIKIDPYSNLENGRLSEKRESESLDFDFDSKSKDPEKSGEKESEKTEFYPVSDPLVGMKKGETDSCDEIDTGKCSSIIDDFQQTDDLDKLCNISLDSSCMMPLIPEDSQEPRLQEECPIDPMNNVLEELESSDEKEEWVEVRSMDEEPNDVLMTLESANEVEKSDNKMVKQVKSIFDTSEDSQSTGFDEFMRKKNAEVKREERTQEVDKNCKIQSFRRTHKDTDVEIHVANINVEKLYDSASEATDAIEIKINVSRHDKKFRIKSIEKSEERSEKKGNYSPGRIFSRRTSNPEESRKSRKEMRRRHSGNYRYRKSIEERANEIRSKKIGKYELPKSFKDETSLSEGPASSQESAGTLDSKLRTFAPEFDELETMASKALEIPQTEDTWNKLSFFDASMDFDNFDVAPNENPDVRDDVTSSTLTEDRALSKRLEECEKYRNPYKNPESEALEVDLNSVPVYTTKDGRIKYSPNPKYTYRVLIMEARERETNFSRIERKSGKRREKWGEFNGKKGRRVEDSSWRSNRCSKYDRWRERPPEVESEDPSIESIKRLEDSTIPERKTSFSFDEEREDSFVIGCINNLTVASQSHEYLKIESVKSVEKRIFNGDELELFSRKEKIEEKLAMKPPESVDLEQDSQMLTDSGLESSTTYTEGSKGPRLWQKEAETHKKEETIEKHEEKIREEEIKKIDEKKEINTKLTQFLSRKHENFESRVLKGLDLAFPSGNIYKNKSEPPRRASSDEVREEISFFANKIKFPESVKNLFSEGIKSLGVEHQFEKPEVPFGSCKNFPAPARKIEVESPEMSTESEVSGLDTLSSTQFGSEFAAGSSGLNFLSTSSQEAVDATDLKAVRKDLALCALTDKSKTENSEEKVIKFSSESEDDSNAQDGSPIGLLEAQNEGKTEGSERILNFSGKIQSPEPKSSSPLRIHVSIEEKTPENSLNFTGKIPSPTTEENPDLTFGRIRSKSPIFEKIPKFIIKKTDSSRSSSISQIFPSELSLHPKIPKMIIRNVRSRPGTPTIEENAVELSFPKTHETDNEKVFEVKIKLDEPESRTLPKMRIKRERSDKVPKLKIIKEQRVSSVSPEPSKRKRAKTPENHHKKKKSSRHRSLESRENSKSLPLDLESTSTNLSEKIPKVIIKRASSTSEFKCELSKDGGESILDSKWQPEVKLERFSVLDSIAKEKSRVPLKILETVSRLTDSMSSRGSRKLRRTSSDPSNIEKSECKKRRHSDPENQRILDESLDARSSFPLIEKKPDFISDGIECSESVIKLESSDESQTTIELLPVLSDLSQESEVPTPMEGERRIANGDMARVYSSDAIPTQFELELEIVDQEEGSLEVPIPETKESWDSEAPGPSFRCESFKNEAKSICSSDSLVKDVLAAKESLKRYLTTSRHVKTPAEKKVFPEFSGEGNVFQKGKERDQEGKREFVSVKEKKIREIMPILEPEGGVNFEVNERDSSRSPPVITKQDSRGLPESPKKVEVNEKIEETEAMTFADIVAKMAYHEKATIKHRRYCILCERWFPTTARHRRHLSGYQHRHTELTQRRTVHALFMLFTGKPCPRLLPASIVRTDCAPGEPTPLQIAVQDVAISLEKATIDKTKRIKEEDE